ncbi:hypothetical protein D0Z07_0376 [Hyphodiscus hymeniophilus]|uniref:Uncharacterized protein n=1 Tax=Hyphodiscus hymeniophilus TaxID=353542 RepID=A0A9P6VSM5_9HELO|nr:hypothetical protein D0Z07_0376 [Hyphodiscus hymeniophilus]
MWPSVLATSLLLVGQVSAGVLGDGTLLVRRDRTEQRMRRYVDSIVEPKERRQTAATNITSWDAQTMTACTTALSAMNGNAGNPSGMAACYNLPSLDSTTGVFRADLRLFTISAPSGTFANIPSQDVMVGLSYVGATVSAVNTSSLLGRRDLESLISWPRGVDGGMQKRGAPAPTMSQAYAFVGQINKDLLTPNMDNATLEKLLLPTITLTGMQSNGQNVNTSLSSSEATFVSGVFAKAATPVSKAAVQSPIQTLVVASGAPFVLPGLKIIIAPIGAVITVTWAILFIAIVGYGTIGRMQFRDQYRRRSTRANKGDLARI